MKVETRRVEVSEQSGRKRTRVTFNVELDVDVAVEGRHSFEISFEVLISRGLDDAVTQAQADLEAFAHDLAKAAQQLAATP